MSKINPTIIENNYIPSNLPGRPVLFPYSIISNWIFPKNILTEKHYVLSLSYDSLGLYDRGSCLDPYD